MEEKDLKKMYSEIEIEMELGNIEKMAPVQFVLNMISLLIFPSAVRPLFLENMLIDEKEFDLLIADRKDIIMNILFKK